jgi:hypothetical protein
MQVLMAHLHTSSKGQFEVRLSFYRSPLTLECPRLNTNQLKVDCG